MTCRKWCVRGLVFSVLALLACGIFAWQRWTNPEEVRRQVIERLGAELPGAIVSIESAHMRFLGGISVNGLKLVRRDDPDKAELLYVPSAIFHPDKEQVLEGKINIRKIELFRPKVRVIRDKEDGWNVVGLLGPVDLRIAVPTITIQQGTIVFEDRKVGAGGDPLILSDVNLTVINDPRPTLNYQLVGKCDPLGPIQVAGTIERVTDAADLGIDLPSIAITPTVIQTLGRYCSATGEHTQNLGGRMHVHIDLCHQPESPRPWSHKVRMHLTNGNFSHPMLPMALNDVDASLVAADGQCTLEKLTAQSGTAQVELSGWARFSCDRAISCAPAACNGTCVRRSCILCTPQTECANCLIPEDTDFEGDLKIKNLSVCSEILGRLPANLRKLQNEYEPRGPVHLSIAFSRKQTKWKKKIVVQPLDLTATFCEFKYPLEHITGSLEQDIDAAQNLDTLHVDLVGLAGTQKVFVKGDMTGEGDRPAVNVKVWGDGLPINETMLAALPAAEQAIARSFRPTGNVNFEAYIQRAYNAEKCSNRYIVHLSDATCRFDEFPYPLEKVSGVLDVMPDHWECRDARGEHKGGVVRVRGRSYESIGGDRLSIELNGSDFLIDEELEASLKPDLRTSFKVFRPRGRMDFVAKVEQWPNKEPELDITVTPRKCTMMATFFPYALTDIEGTVRYARDWVILEHMQARHGTSLVTIDEAKAYIKPKGGVWVDIVQLHGAPLIPDDDLVHALPPCLKEVCTTLRLRDPLTLDTRLTLESFAEEEGKEPVLFWDGSVAIKDAKIRAGVDIEQVTGKAASRGRYNSKSLEGMVGNLQFERAVLFGQTITDIQCPLEIRKEEPNTLVMPNLKAKLYGGDLYGPVRVDLGPIVRYNLNLTASQLRLEEFARQNLDAKAKVSGMATAHITLSGSGSELKDLTGRGNIDVPNGRLYHLPLFLDLLKFLGLRLPDGTAFEEAHVNFAIQGPRVKVDRVDLLGNAVSLRGQGEMNLDGSDINLDFYAVWARVTQMLPPIIKEIPPAISKQLLKVKMRGRVGDVRCTKEPVPILVDPVRELLDRMAGR